MEPCGNTAAIAYIALDKGEMLDRIIGPDIGIAAERAACPHDFKGVDPAVDWHFKGVFFNLGARSRPRHAVTCGERVRIRSGGAALYNVMDDATEIV